jgi:hypothetical protein
VLRILLVSGFCALGLAGVSGAGAAANPVQKENDRPGDVSWAARYASGGAIEGYLSEVSLLPGGTLHLHVSTAPAARYRVNLIRLGWYAGKGGRLVGCWPSCRSDKAGETQQAPSQDPASHMASAGWPVTDTLAVPASAVSGYWVAQLVLTSGPQAGRVRDVPFVVRQPATARSRVLVQVPVNTWQAYNPWGGSCLYRHPVCGQRATGVSFDRPYGWETPLQDPIHWELPLIHFLERQGVDVSYQTDADTDADPGSLLRHRLALVAGHSEYWTKAMFDAFDTARDQGTNLAFMGANAVYWQVRYDLGRRVIVAYKNSPDPELDPTLQTVRFSELKPPRYECELVGVQHLGGAFNHRTDDYIVNPEAIGDPWFRQTGFTAGSIVRQVVSGERDDLAPNQIPGQTCGHPMTVLFEHPDSNTNNLDAAKALRYTAVSGARVFAAGSHEFAYGLDPLSHPQLADPRLQRFMVNALDDLGRPAPPTLQLAATGRRVRITTTAPPDPRITTQVFRIGLGRPVRVTRCASADRCLDLVPGPGLFRYKAVSVDRWGHSYETFAALRIG